MWPSSASAWKDRVHMQYHDKQVVATLKGVDESFSQANPIDSSAYVWVGAYDFSAKNGIAQGVFGQGVANQLALNINDQTHPIQITVLNDQAGSLSLLEEVLSFSRIYPAGVFNVQKEYDDKYVLTGLEYSREVLGRPGMLTGYELSLHKGKNPVQVQKELQALLGDRFRVVTLREKHAALYRVMRNEKYVSYLILTLLLAVAAVNIVGSLSMIVLEKTRDIAVLKSMGGTVPRIRRIFLSVGLLVGSAGVCIGMTIAFAFGWLQERYGLIGANDGEFFRVNAFPMVMRWEDFLLIFLTVMGLSLLASLYPSHKASQITMVEGLQR